MTRRLFSIDAGGVLTFNVAAPDFENPTDFES